MEGSTVVVAEALASLEVRAASLDDLKAKIIVKYGSNVVVDGKHISKGGHGVYMKCADCSNFRCHVSFILHSLIRYYLYNILLCLAEEV